MSKVIITHKVSDVNNWLSFHKERSDAIAALGGTDVVDFVAADGSADVALTTNVKFVEQFLEGLVASRSQELQTTMDRHGDVGPLTIYVEK